MEKNLIVSPDPHGNARWVRSSRCIADGSFRWPATSPPQKTEDRALLDSHALPSISPQISHSIRQTQTQRSPGHHAGQNRRD